MTPNNVSVFENSYSDMSMVTEGKAVRLFLSFGKICLRQAYLSSVRFDLETLFQSIMLTVF